MESVDDHGQGAAMGFDGVDFRGLQDDLDITTLPAFTAELGVENIRVFGGGDPERHSKPEMADIGQQMMQRVLELDGAGRFKWVFETHDHWISSADCQLLLERVTVPESGALWDMGHTPRVGGETPGGTLAVLGDRVYYLHVKDAVHDPDHPQAMGDGWHYVVPGTGQLPLVDALRLLEGRGYDGWVMFEHEKRWHDDLETPEEIFPMFIEWFGSLGL